MTKTILVVDDDNLVRMSLSETLTTAGFHVEIAEDGVAGLAKATALHPDLIISDVRMPGLDGMQMVEKLRADEWGKQVPVIILSTEEKTTTINQALANGITVYLSKTQLSPDQIAEEVKRSL